MKYLARVFIFTALWLVACAAPTVAPVQNTPLPAVGTVPAAPPTSAPSPAPATATAQPVASPTAARVPAALPTVASQSSQPTGAAAANPDVVSADTLNGKVIFGYQGWFSCPTDGSKLGAYYHWTKRAKTFTAADITVDNWPDVSELAPEERCPTGMKLPDGSPAVVFSSFNPKTVDRHFQWMKQYGIDGVAVQRFVTGLDSANQFDFRNQVLTNVRNSAQANGRVFYVEYDATGKDPGALVSAIEKDWTFLVDNLKITTSPSYLKDNGLPVLQIYGLGFSSHPEVTADMARQLSDYFKSSSPAKYHVTLIAGVPSYWRTGTHDASSGADWAAAFRTFDVISPWAVGRYKNDADADKYMRDIITPDLAETAKNNIRYMPVIFPGFSWTNLNRGPQNDIPRRCGSFYWHQAFNAVSAGAKTLFVAMFDEVDEGTAMFKLATTQDQLPTGANLVPLNIDGCNLPSDWYLRLGGESSKMLRGNIKLTPDIPIKPGTP